MDSTIVNLPDRLMHFHALAKGQPAYAVFAPIVEAAEEIRWLRRHIQCLMTENPCADAADGVSVLDVWRQQVIERYGHALAPAVSPSDPRASSAPY